MDRLDSDVLLICVGRNFARAACISNKNTASAFQYFPLFVRAFHKKQVEKSFFKMKGWLEAPKGKKQGVISYTAELHDTIPISLSSYAK